MKLNTSFNTLPGELIVESPSDAISSFLYSMGSIETLIMVPYTISRKDMDVKSLLDRVEVSGNMKSEPQCPVCAGPLSIETTTTVSDNKETTELITRLYMMSRAIHDDRGGGLKDSRGWFKTLDDMEVQVLAMCDGTNDIQDGDKQAGRNQPVY